MPHLDFPLKLSRNQCLAYYRGSARQVHARSLDGQRVAFPASALSRIMTRTGVHGIYRLTFDDGGHFLSLTWQRPLPPGHSG
ncbi:DUF2835 family protein [Halomonas marinisediminis]|uniref:DUF2835 family protein n=1 Tax=Halomonas marinisediminis TaxID=2546095 RepID=A0ABY2D5I3_9GAMM|nr:DUF2835 family protein [Halomonas marinisediminis]TDB01953.1 DUF2835 family protein [Halomonas marinisediminis]